MSKSYSNKALPSGTVLREWRLEEVLGVGGFGIVYKGRGIYFDELVAIKEYFPSAISERNEGDTVVPIDSEAEEVHALGLKKFVEEAKLLWNLSTPTRHPNIVSVRSLFEIHGTAYIVMDFEDGVSLSKLLRDGKRFNEASLLALIKPVAEGLDRAHRVGVLHRDIKPPNILVNLDGRPVLIDFGSARFESADATSTKVTFHTPPYAAIEQYVKTYPQGPWTDVYALGVVLYECVTGEKPPEVLERMHGGLGKPLADGDWPGFSRPFLKAVDAAMTIRPADRPQSIADWLALFSNPDDGPAAASDADDGDDVTRFMPFQSLPEKIVPVAPPPPGFEDVGKVDTPVPDSTSGVQFKRAGHDTNASRTLAGEVLPNLETPEAPSAPASAGPKAAKPKPKARPEAAIGAAGKPAKSKRMALVAGAAVAVAGVLAGGWYFAQNGKMNPGIQPDTTLVTGSSEGIPSEAAALPVPVGAGQFAQAVQSLAAEARSAGAPGAAVSALSAAGARLASLYSDLPGLTGDAATARNQEIAALARSASAGFAAALTRDGEARTQRLGRDLAWADPRRANAARTESGPRQKIALDLRQARSQLLSAASSASGSTDAGQAIAAARQALMASRRLIALSAAAYGSKAATQTVQVATAAPTEAAVVATPSETPSPTSNSGVSARKMQQFNSAVVSAREIAANVIRMGPRSRPSSGASSDEKERYRILDQSKKSAQGYLSYLDNLARSIRRAKSDREADLFIAQAEQTRRYLGVLLSRSAAAGP